MSKKRFLRGFGPGQAEMELARMDTLQRLGTAQEKTKEVLENEPIVRELDPGTDIANKWMVITAAYSGLEQTLKYLIAEGRENGKITRDLRTHNVGRLFSNLEIQTQMVIQEYFERFLSLHCYITVATVEEFLEMISDPDGRGYEKWRYALIEEQPLPKNSPEALVAIWDVCVQIGEERLWENSWLKMPDESLCCDFYGHLQKAVGDVSIDRQNAGEPYQDIMVEIDNWLCESSHPLNVFAEVLWEVRTYGEYRRADMSEWSSEALTRWAKDVKNTSACGGATFLRAFVIRAQGCSPYGQSLRWNPDCSRFEAIPWSLEERRCDTQPEDAAEIHVMRQTGMTCLRQAAKMCGCHVRENWGEQSEGLYVCRLELNAEIDCDADPILTIWQKRMDRDDLFYMVEHQPRDALYNNVQQWIALAQRGAEMRRQLRLTRSRNRSASMR